MKSPTRETANSRSLIDHIYITNEDRVTNVDVHKIRLSDHYPVYFSWQFVAQKSNSRCHNSITYRPINKIDMCSFRTDLSNCNSWESTLREQDTDKALAQWNSAFLNVLNRHAPRKVKRVKRKHQPRWCNNEIMHAIKMRDRTKSTDLSLYRFWRNKVTSLVRTAKETFLDMKL